MKTTPRFAVPLLVLAGIGWANSALAVAQPLNQVPVAVINEGVSDLMAEPGGRLRVRVGDSYDPDPSDGIVSYALDLNIDGIFDLHGYPLQFSANFWDVPPSFLVPYELLIGPLSLGAGVHDLRLRVTDMNGAVAFDTARFTILPAAVAPPVAVPEPQTWGLALAGFGALWATRRRHGTAAAGRI